MEVSALLMAWLEATYRGDCRGLEGFASKYVASDASELEKAAVRLFDMAYEMRNGHGLTWKQAEVGLKGAIEFLQLYVGGSAPD